MKTAAELAAIAEARRQEVQAGRTAKQLATTAAFEAKVATIMAEFRTELAKVDAAAAAGLGFLSLRRERGDVRAETDTPLAVAWSRIRSELVALGFKVEVRNQTYYDGGWDQVSGSNTYFTITW